MNKLENPSAFPWANDADKLYNWISRGMTLRDYFGAQAMQALLSDPNWREDMDFEETASAAYAMADRMLRARE